MNDGIRFKLRYLWVGGTRPRTSCEASSLDCDRSHQGYVCRDGRMGDGAILEGAGAVDWPRR